MEKAMTRYSPHTMLYDDIADVMRFGLGESRSTNEFEAAPGVHVLYAYDNGMQGKVVAVEIEYYKERYGDDVTEMLVPADSPFIVSL